MSLILTSGSKFEITLAPEAEILKLGALEAAKGITKVSDGFQQQIAVDARNAMKDILKKVESSKRAAKEPALTFGKQIDSMAKKFVAELEDGVERLDGLINPYQAEKMRIAQEAECRRQEEMKKIVATGDLDAIRNAPKPIEAPKVEGQRVREFWTFEVLDLKELYAHDPSLVRMEANTSAINARISNGQQLPGLRVFKQIKT